MIWSKVVNEKKTSISFRQELMNSAILMLLTFSLGAAVSGFTVSISISARVALVAQCAWLSFLAAKIKLKISRNAQNVFLGVSCTSFVIFSALVVSQIFLGFSDTRPEVKINFSSRVCRIINSIVPEEVGVLIMARILPFLGGLTLHEGHDLVPSIANEYNLMRSNLGEFPSTLPTSVLGLEGSLCKTTLSIDNKSVSGKGNGTVIFLHGFGGNWSLLCGIMTEVAGEFGLSTICPSVGPFGMWSSDEARKTFEEVLSNLSTHNSGRVYLAGISAGAVGASNFAVRYRDKITGLILLFGSGIEPPATPLRTLLIYGAQDERFTPNIIKKIIEIRKKRGDVNLEVNEIEGDHLAIVKKKSEIQAIMREWFAH